jgi:cell division protein FtsL
MGGHGTIRLALAFALLLASLSLVVWRQSRALEVLRELDAARAERALTESERTTLLRRVQLLQTRTRIVTAAGDRLGMRVPSHAEIVILTETSR